MRLRENRRLTQEPPPGPARDRLEGFSQFLLNLGSETIPNFPGTLQVIPIPVEYILSEQLAPCPPHETASQRSGRLMDAIINFVFQNLETRYSNTEYLRSRLILCPSNEDTERLNRKISSRIPGIGIYYVSADSLNLDEFGIGAGGNAGNQIQNDLLDRHPVEFLNTLTPSVLPTHVMTLKSNSPVILLRN